MSEPNAPKNPAQVTGLYPVPEVPGLKIQLRAEIILTKGEKAAIDPTAGADVPKVEVHLTGEDQPDKPAEWLLLPTAHTGGPVNLYLLGHRETGAPVQIVKTIGETKGYRATAITIRAEALARLIQAAREARSRLGRDSHRLGG